MDADSWSTRVSSLSKRYQSSLQSRSDLFLGFEEFDAEDEIREEYPCPYCAEYFDIVGLCCHIDDEHPLEAKNGVCPVCTNKVGIDMVAHITLQHGNIFRSRSRRTLENAEPLKLIDHNDFVWISLTKSYTQRKRKSYKGGSHSNLSLLRKELREGNLQSLLGGSSYVVSSNNAAPDPLSSFILPMCDELVKSERQSSADTIFRDNGKDEKSVERPLSIKDKKERAKRSVFIHELLSSAIFDNES